MAINISTSIYIQRYNMYWLKAWGQEFSFIFVWPWYSTSASQKWTLGLGRKWYSYTFLSLLTGWYTCEGVPTQSSSSYQIASKLGTWNIQKIIVYLYLRLGYVSDTRIFFTVSWHISNTANEICCVIFETYQYRTSDINPSMYTCPSKT